MLVLYETLFMTLTDFISYHTQIITRHCCEISRNQKKHRVEDLIWPFFTENTDADCGSGQMLAVHQKQAAISQISQAKQRVHVEIFCRKQPVDNDKLW